MKEGSQVFRSTVPYMELVLMSEMAPIADHPPIQVCVASKLLRMNLASVSILKIKMTTLKKGHKQVISKLVESSSNGLLLLHLP